MKQPGLLIGSAVGAVGLLAAVLFGWAWRDAMAELKSLQEVSAADLDSLRTGAARDATDTAARSALRREAHRKAREEKAALEGEKAALEEKVVGGKLAAALQHGALEKLKEEKKALEEERAELEESVKKTARLLERADSSLRNQKKDARFRSGRQDKLVKERDALRRTLQRQRDQSDEIDRLIRQRDDMESTLTGLLYENRYLKALLHRRHLRKEE